MQSYKRYFTDKVFVRSFFEAILLLLISLVAQFYISGYATLQSSSSVTDIILSNTRVWDVDGIFVWGSIILAVIGLFIVIRRINYLPFAFKSFALFTLIRSTFVMLTHISPFPTHAVIESVFFNGAAFNGIFTGNDLFFSGHTGLPFLLALMTWHDKFLRYMFLGFSAMFAVVVLLGHLHYSIDVLAAYFITYTIYHICLWLFRRERIFFLEE